MSIWSIWWRRNEIAWENTVHSSMEVTRRAVTTPDECKKAQIRRAAAETCREGTHIDRWEKPVNQNNEM